MVRVTAPERGDIILLSFEPQRGREQTDKRPALVLSPHSYNTKTGLAVLCPITSQAKGYPFEIGLPSFLKTKGVILVDQVKSLDWQTREARILERVPSSVLVDTLSKLSLLIG